MRESKYFYYCYFSVMKCCMKIKKKLFSEFKKQVIGKLNKILYRTDAIENKLHQLENDIQFQDIDNSEECDIQFPLETLQDLNNFEELLQESQFKQEMV